MFTFEAPLIRPDAPGTWTYLVVPFDVPAAFGTATRVPVKGTVNGAEFRSSLMPQGDGTFILVVNRELREKARVGTGDRVKVTLERDEAPREVEVPDDLQLALDGAPEAGSAFGRLSYSHRKEYVSWILDAKKPETRQRRISKALEMLAEGKKLKG